MPKGPPALDLFEVLDRLLDDRVGILESVEELPRQAGAPNFFHFAAYACSTLPFAGQENFRKAGGASADRSTAMAKAIGEAVERYCSAIYTTEEHPFASYSSSTVACVPPSTFALYSDAQYQDHTFRYARFSEKTQVRWTALLELESKEVWHVPSAMVFLPYSFDSETGEPPFVQRISTGLACHGSLERASISAICEVVERDAFTIVWQARMSPPRIVLETLSGPNLDLVSRLARCRSAVTLLDATMDHGIPTVIGVLASQQVDAPAIVVAASADLNPEEAVRKTLEELAHTRRLSTYLKYTRPKFRPDCDFLNVRDQDDHVHLYCDQDMASMADFLFSSDELKAFGEMSNLSSGNDAADLKVLVRQIAGVGHKALVVDLTTPDVEELGLKVVRAVVPGFHPLFMGHGLRALGGSRLWTVPQKLGYEGIDKLSGDNPAPHPYP